MKIRIPRSVRNTFIGVFSLLLLLVGGGVGYTWYIGQSENQEVLAASVPETPVNTKARQPFSPPVVAEDANVSASVQSLSTPVSPGKNAAVTVKTLPKAACVTKVTYGDIVSQDSGLAPKIADEYGVVSWSWTVDPAAPVGTWPVEITCTNKDKSAFVRGNLEVK